MSEITFDKPITIMDFIYDSFAGKTGFSEETTLFLANKLIDEGIGDLEFGIEFNAKSNNNIYDPVHPENNNTYYVYLYGLKWLWHCLRAYEITGNIKYLNSFEVHARKFCDHYKNTQYKSHLMRDYSIWQRTLVFTKALMLLGDNWNLRETVLHVIYDDSLWCTNPLNHATGNHYLMTQFTLLHTSVLFKEYDFSRHYLNLSITSINENYLKSFYSDGVNNEGGPFYFQYNINFYKNLIAFCNHYHISGLEKIDDSLEFNENAFRYFLRTDGSYPPIGDSDNIKADPLILGVPESGCFKESGYSFLKNGLIYMSLKDSSIFDRHHHADNLSITLRAFGVDIICDSGRYNYKNNNPIRQYLRSVRAHSMIAPTSFDNLTMSQYYNAITDAKITSFSVNSVVAFYYVGDLKLTVWRECLLYDNMLIVTDRWNSDTTQTMRARFIINPDFISNSVFNSKEKKISSENGSLNLEISAVSEQQFDCQLNAGYKSDSYNDIKLAAHYDVVTAGRQGSIKTTIKFWR